MLSRGAPGVHRSMNATGGLPVHQILIFCAMKCHFYVTLSSMSLKTYSNTLKSCKYCRRPSYSEYVAFQNFALRVGMGSSRWGTASKISPACRARWADRWAATWGKGSRISCAEGARGIPATISLCVFGGIFWALRTVSKDVFRLRALRARTL